MHTLSISDHVAHLLPDTGDGLLVLPHLGQDVADPLSSSAPTLQEVQWGEVMARLDRMGWEPFDGEHGGLTMIGHLADGREVAMLYGRATTGPMPEVHAALAAFDDLCSEVGVTVTG